MKKILFGVLFIVALFFSSLSIKACQFNFDIVNAKGEKIENISYKNGNEIIVEIKYKQTHRNCNLSIDATKFTVDGFKIISTTKWKTDKNNESSKKLKLKIIDNQKTNSTLTVIRECDRGKHTDTFTLKKT